MPFCVGYYFCSQPSSIPCTGNHFAYRYSSMLDAKLLIILSLTLPQLFLLFQLPYSYDIFQFPFFIIFRKNMNGLFQMQFTSSLFELVSLKSSLLRLCLRCSSFFYIATSLNCSYSKLNKPASTLVLVARCACLTPAKVMHLLLLSLSSFGNCGHSGAARVHVMSCGRSHLSFLILCQSHRFNPWAGRSEG